MSGLAKLPKRMTVAEFLNWHPNDGQKWQLFDGELRAMAPANAVHAYLQNELGRLIGNHLRASNLPCDVFTNAGVIPLTMSAHNMRIPDILVSCSPFDLKQAAPDNPVVIIEILSPSNRADTWANVWAYTSIPSVQEIFVLRTDEIGGELLRRSADGAWADQTSPVEHVLELTSLAFQLTLSELYARTPLGKR